MAGDNWTADDVVRGVERKQVFIGRLRVNAKQNKDAYISVAGKDDDILIQGYKARNKSFHGDVVAVKVHPEAEWKPVSPMEEDSPSIQWTGHVVKVMEARNAIFCAGYIKKPQNNQTKAQFIPRNRCYPVFLLAQNDVLRPYLGMSQAEVGRFLFLGRIDVWFQNCTLPHGTAVKCLGEGSDIDTENSVLLSENGIIDEEFSSEVIDCLPEKSPWRVPVEEIEHRVDYRDDCVFTIDPPTARDLDDALSCTENNDGTWNVGVHIADVTYFVEEGTPLDDAAKDRATSVYLVQRVVPMLPSLLCEELCSLNPGEDRLAYSVVWRMNNKGDILETNFHRSVIRSCAKLSYANAQALIDGTELDEVFPVFYGQYGMIDAKDAVRRLWRIGQSLRQHRLENGALKLTQPKLTFSFDGDGQPVGCHASDSSDSKSMIGEFMLLANITVAEKIHRCFPDHAVLRRHPEPKMRSLLKAAEICRQHRIELDCSSSKLLQESIDATIADNYSPEADSPITAAVTHYCAKSMELAQYFCSSDNTDPLFMRHYGLSAPIYTHFTSPIRRYADIMVHRLLTSALNHQYPHWSPTDLSNKADNCNKKRLTARKAQETSAEIYFKEFVNVQGSYAGQGVVVGILDRAIDVLLIRGRKVMRVRHDQMKQLLSDWEYDGESKKEAGRTVTLTWKQSGEAQRLMYFSRVEVCLTIEKTVLVTRLVPM